MLIVSDSSPITNLIQVGLLDILKKLFGEITIPEQVYWELANYEKQKAEIDVRSWILIRKVSNENEVLTFEGILDSGEAEAIVLSRELGAERLLIDEKKGREIAQKLGLKIIGLLGILVLAKRKGHITLLKPILEKLVKEANFYIHPKLYEKILKEDSE